MCKTSTMISSTKQLNPEAKAWHPPSQHKPQPPPYWPAQTPWFWVPPQIYKKQNQNSCFFGSYSNSHTTAIPLIYPSPSLCCYITHHQPQSPPYAPSQWPLHRPSAAGGGRVDAKTSPSLANKRSARGLRINSGDTHHPCRYEWKRKNNNMMSKSSGCVVHRDECSSPPPQKIGGRSTVMIRNIPNQYRRHMLLGFLDKLCHEQNHKAQNESDHPLPFQYDFVYLPMDFGSGDNYGYAFVNFTSAIAATRIQKLLDNNRWDVFQDSKGRLCRSKKICEITWARIQGKEELVKHFRNSHFVCRDPEYLPVVFSTPRDGVVPAAPTPIGRCLVSKS